MGNIVSSTIFCVRNTDKVENGDFGRLPVAIGQARNVVNSVMSFDGALGKTAQGAVDVLSKASKNEALLKYAGKAVNLVGENINPLICLSAGVKVLTSDDKVSTGIQQASALSAMFAVEKFMSKNLEGAIKSSITEIKKLKDKKGLEKTFKNFENFIGKHKLQGKLPKVLYGVLFVLGSCGAYGAGEKLGTLVTSGIKNEGGNIDKKA